MGINQKKYLRRLLLYRKRLLVADIRSIEQGLCDAPAHPGVDQAEQSCLDAGMEIQFSALAYKSSQLQQIDAALERQESGKYGYCHICQKAISHERLRVIPFAQMCVECQREEERVAEELAPQYAGSWERVDYLFREQGYERPSVKMLSLS
jgi:DnaK suppressor protein